MLLKLLRAEIWRSCPPAPRLRAARPKQEEPKHAGNSPGPWQYAAGVCLPVPDQRHRPGGGVRLRPEGARSTRVPAITTPSLWARSEQGKIRHLHARGTLTGSHFRQTLPGSEKEYSFHWQGANGKLYAFEAPVDMLSFISLHPEGWQKHSYVALCGVSAAPIHHLLETQPQLEEVTLCLDSDEAGQAAARRIAGELLREWNVTVSAEFPTLKDWNDELLAYRQEENQGTDHVHVIFQRGFSSGRNSTLLTRSHSAYLVTPAPCHGDRGRGNYPG